MALLKNPLKPISKHTLSIRQVALKHGFRSGLEEAISQDLTSKGVGYLYEEFVIPYIKPEKSAKYTPDWILPNGIIVESKGRYLTEDRQKMILVKKQHPHLDIRFVYSNSKTKIAKRSKTTYADWSIKNGFPFADRLIPDSWIKEEPNRNTIEAVQTLWGSEALKRILSQSQNEGWT